MELRPNVFHRQKQSLSITNQVIQSIKLLQFGGGDLEEFLHEQADDNPLITVVGGPAAQDRAGLSGDTGASGRDAPAERRTAPRLPMSGPREEAVDLDQYVAARVSLRDHLNAQVALALDAPVDRLIAHEIVDSLDPDGYFRRDPEEMAEILGVAPGRIEAGIKAVQDCEPTGVGARTLAECLALQLAERGLLTEPMRALLDNLDLLGDYKIERLARICRIGMAEVLGLAQQIRALDPRPGRRFDTDPVIVAVPDIHVDPTAEGGWSVELNTGVMPRVLIDREYFAEVSAKLDGATDRRFLVDSMRNATWLARNVDQRAQTILKVATEIVIQQSEFFHRGAAYLKPLSLKDIASEVELHESTVCRAVAGKYMMTPRGMFELKFFFANALGVTDGEDALSVETVRHRIRQLVDAEAPTSILSDQAIMDMLRAEGIDIARRTVAKYREMMDIPTSRKRKRLKASITAAAADAG